MFLLQTTLCFSGVIDFGVQGKQFPIIEENGIDFIKRRIKEIDKDALNKEYMNGLSKLEFSNLVLPTSKIDSNKTVEDIYLSKWDITDPVTLKVLYAKGEQIPTKMKKGERLEFCFIDGSLKKEITNQIISIFGANCIYFVNKINVFKFENIYNVKAYPIGGQNLNFIKRYKVKVLPTKITRYLDKKNIITLDVNRLAIKSMKGKE
jgi:hypothetical protein